jgi:hypothetical protein
MTPNVDTISSLALVVYGHFGTQYFNPSIFSISLLLHTGHKPVCFSAMVVNIHPQSIQAKSHF